MKQLVLGFFIIILHSALLLTPLPFSEILVSKKQSSFHFPIVWVQHLRETPLEQIRTQNPLEHAQAITEDLLETMIR